MTKLADYIERIEINSLWSGHKHIVWELNPSVNVLSGKNGAGKSTILNRMVQHLREMPASGELGDHEGMGVTMRFHPADATGIRYDVLRSFDRKMVVTERTVGIADAHVVTELDWQLYLVQRRFLD